MQKQSFQRTQFASPGPRLLLGQGMTVNLPERDQWIIGRGAPGGLPVDVDLGPFGAGELGVSRHHARITSQAGGFTVEDLDSQNETSVNGERLSPGQTYPLVHGDRLGLGLLRCVFLQES